MQKNCIFIYNRFKNFVTKNLKLVEIESNNQNKGNHERHHFIKNGPIRKSPDQKCKPFFVLLNEFSIDET